jgi:hypothetical protein
MGDWKRSRRVTGAKLEQSGNHFFRTDPTVKQEEVYNHGAPSKQGKVEIVCVFARRRQASLHKHNHRHNQRQRPNAKEQANDYAEVRLDLQLLRQEIVAVYQRKTETGDEDRGEGLDGKHGSWAGTHTHIESERIPSPVSTNWRLPRVNITSGNCALPSKPRTDYENPGIASWERSPPSSSL